MRASETNGWISMWWEAWNDFETSVACNTLNALTPSRWGKEPYFQLWFYLLLTVLSFALCECGNEWTPFWRKLISNKLRMISEIYLLYWELCERKEKKNYEINMGDSLCLQSNDLHASTKWSKNRRWPRNSCIHGFELVNCYYSEKNWFNAALRNDAHSKFLETSFRITQK